MESRLLSPEELKEIAGRDAEEFRFVAPEMAQRYMTRHYQSNADRRALLGHIEVLKLSIQERERRGGAHDDLRPWLEQRAREAHDADTLLDSLEAFVLREGALLLHTGDYSGFGFSGLAFGGARVSRTLREALAALSTDGAVLPSNSEA